MTWAIHCRIDDTGERAYALFSTVIMDYLHDGAFRSKVEMVNWVFRHDLTTWLNTDPEYRCKTRPNLASWRKCADFAEQYGNSEDHTHFEEAAQCVSGCRCYLHREVRNELHDAWHA